jgi:hypothetical protein
MKAQTVRHSTAKPNKELQVRLVLMEEGSSPGALVCKEDVGTTAVVAISSEPVSRLTERIERRVAELSRSGRTVREVVYLVASNADDEGSSRRRAALRAVVHALQGTTAGIVLVVPDVRSAILRSELFGLTEALMADGGPRLRVRLRFTRAPEERPSGIFLSPAAVHQEPLQPMSGERPALRLLDGARGR